MDSSMNQNKTRDEQFEEYCLNQPSLRALHKSSLKWINARYDFRAGFEAAEKQYLGEIETLKRALAMESNEPEERSQEAAHYNWLDEQNKSLKADLDSSMLLLDQSEYAMRMFKEQTEAHGGDYLPGHAKLFNTVRDKIITLKSKLGRGEK